MPKSFLFYLFVFYSASFFAQAGSNLNNQANTIESIPQLYVDGVFYPEFLLGEKFHNAQMGYRISDNLMVEIQTFYSRFGTKERLRIPMFFKAEIIKDIYLLAGPEVEFDLMREVNTRNPRLSINSGIQYQKEDSFYINALLNYQINDSNVGPQGNIGKSNLISLSSGLKF